KLDPKFFEAQMNFAAVNLGFRGFDQARSAYEKALAMHPNDYDAHLGMALALRGPITGTESDYDQRVNAVQSELDAAKKIDPNRPDAYYNEGILTMEFKAKAGGDKEKTKAALSQAQQIFQSFIDKASGKPEYDGAVKRSKERIQDAEDTKKFLDLGVDDKSGGNNSPPPPDPNRPAGGPAWAGWERGGGWRGSGRWRSSGGRSGSGGWRAPGGRCGGSAGRRCGSGGRPGEEVATEVATVKGGRGVERANSLDPPVFGNI